MAVTTHLGTFEGVYQYKGTYGASPKLADAYLNVPYGLDTSAKRRFSPPQPVTRHVNATLHVKRMPANDYLLSNDTFSEPAHTCWNMLDTAFGDFYGYVFVDAMRFVNYIALPCGIRRLRSPRTAST